MRRTLLAAALALTPAGPAAACALELVLAIDVSGSIDAREFAIQVDGLAAAFESGAVADAIGKLEDPVMAAVTHWSGSSRQLQVIGWRRLSEPGSLLAFADEIRTAPRAFENFSTAIGEALDHAAQVSADNPLDCLRRVIDVSGDGVSNEGRAPRRIALGLAEIGFTINAVVIRGANPDPLPFYRDHVIAGPGAFVEVAEGFDDYPRAILRKLLREIAPPLMIGAAD